jgi:hypothetical protein
MPVDIASCSQIRSLSQAIEVCPVCLSDAASPVSCSARSFPAIPVWPGTHSIWVRHPPWCHFCTAFTTLITRSWPGPAPVYPTRWPLVHPSRSSGSRGFRCLRRIPLNWQLLPLLRQMLSNILFSFYLIHLINNQYYIGSNLMNSHYGLSLEY